MVKNNTCFWPSTHPSTSPGCVFNVANVCDLYESGMNGEDEEKREIKNKNWNT